MKQSMKRKACSKLVYLPPPRVDLPVDLNGNKRFLLFELILADKLIDLPLVYLPVDLNGNLRFLLFKLILADLPPLGLICQWI